MTKYMIVRLKEKEELRTARFMNLGYCRKNNILKPDNYELIYVDTLKTDLAKDSGSEHFLEILENLFEKFNLEIPSDFKRYSLSVGDIIVFKKKGLAFFCDSFGWENITAEFPLNYASDAPELLPVVDPCQCKEKPLANMRTCIQCEL